MRVFKDTEHKYKEFTIKGRQIRTQGGYVLGGRHFVEGGFKRNYIIVKDNLRYYPSSIIGTLKDAKEIVDSIINGFMV